MGLLALWLTGWAGGEPRRPPLYVAGSQGRAQTVAAAAAGLAPRVEVLWFPPWDCLPYDRVSPSAAVMGTRMRCLLRLQDPAPAGGRLILTTAEALIQRVPPRTAMTGAARRIAVGDTVDPDELRLFLLATGYRVDERVDEPGEAALRGAAIDLYVADAPAPCRLELDGNAVTGIRRYDPLTQRSTEEIEVLTVVPASEAVLPVDALRRDDGKAAPDDTATRKLAPFLDATADPPQRLPGGEHQLAALYDELETFLDHLGDARVVLDPDTAAIVEAVDEQVQDAYAARLSLRRSEQASGTAGLLLEPARLYLKPDEWTETLQGRPRLELRDAGRGDAYLPDFRGTGSPQAEMAAFVRERVEAGGRVVLAGGDARQLRQLNRLLERSLGRPAARIEQLAAAAEMAPGTVATLSLELGQGFVSGDLAVIATRDVLARPVNRNVTAAADRAFLSTDLRPGDYVVHIGHGIGILRMLDTVSDDTAKNEHLVLDYAGGGRLLVPVLEMDRVWRYGSQAADVALDRLDGETWAKRRDEVEAQLEQAAAALAALARARARTEAPALKPDGNRYRRFVARFPFALTDDQARAIEATLADLARGSPPMDRLVCGDVGFGKTEVALRAAAVAALAGKEVALLAPTTLLVRQHLNTFRRRFAGLGVRVEQLSRLAKTKEAATVREGLAEGSIGVVIGTHALTSPQIRFKDLALVIIDEEQRFGAGHKEALRRLRKGVHVLTMTATPIPRTLQSALAGLQELSVIATPPVRRQPVRTFVLPFSPAIVRDALMRERRRGGRSFVVVPRIADVEPLARRLAEIVPELDVAGAHGRMRADRLDEVVLGFANGVHDVLLTTSIIETGLDIPGANTMIVCDPERFGMAQLHQLRGRVGRGRERAVFYLLHDPNTELPPATEQRLRALETLEGLGAGFAISAQDLDLRGAGDLLGAEQAGHLKLIGTGLYQHLLARALRRARGEKLAEDWSPELRLGVGMAVPADYVPEPELRLELYARLSRLEQPDELDELEAEITDRFGPAPESVRHMLALATIRLRCRNLGVATIDVGPKAAAATFRDRTAAERRFARRIERAGEVLRWSEERLILVRGGTTVEERLAAATELLDRLTSGSGTAT